MHAYLQGAVAPRPIAFASTVDAAGNVNLSPFSFFNVFGTVPPTLIFSPNRRVRDGSVKHTLENVLEVAEVAINIVDFSMTEQMSLSSCEYPRGVNEFEKSGFTERPSTKIRPPLVLESKASFECKVLEVKSMGNTGGAPNLVICEVVMAHFSEEILDERGMIDQRKTDWVARLGGDWYVRASGDALFEIPKPNQQLGIGMDNLPDFVFDLGFSKNQLARLANIEHLPTPAEIAAFNTTQTYTPTELLSQVEIALQEGNLNAAWVQLLRLPATP